jgi:hypothetical protein
MSPSRACPEPAEGCSAGRLSGFLRPGSELALTVVKGQASVATGRGKSTLPSTRLRTRLKILSRITEPTNGRAETFGGRIASLLDAARGHRLAERPRADPSTRLRTRENIYLNGATLRVGTQHLRAVQVCTGSRSSASSTRRRPERSRRIVAFAETCAMLIEASRSFWIRL